MRRAAPLVLIAALSVLAVACSRKTSDQTGPASAEGPSSGPASQAAATVPQMDGVTCRSSGFAAANPDPGLAKIAQPQVHFIQDTQAGCPSESPTCLANGYVVGGNTVMVGVTKGPYTCVLYPGKNGSAGWVHADQLTPVVVDKAPALKAWAGTWKVGDSTITLTVKDNQLVASGLAKGPTPVAPPPPPPAADGSVATAEPAPTAKMSGIAQPIGAMVQFANIDPAGCSVNLHLVGPFVMASDNGQCSAMNVKFAGVYRKAAAAGGAAGAATGADKHAASSPNTNVFY
jgi:hypothetical protein